MTFIETVFCLRRAACVPCRKFPGGSASPEMNFPVECPYDITTDTAPHEALYSRTHPEQHRGISGCCDRADQF